MIFGVLSVLAAAVLVGVDQLIKRWATVVLLPKTAMTLIPGVLELRYFLNDGMAFSMLGRQTKTADCRHLADAVGRIVDVVCPAS